MEEFITKLRGLEKKITDLFGEKDAGSFLDFFIHFTRFNIRIKLITKELDLLYELYSNHIFIITEDFYKQKRGAQKEMQYNGEIIITKHHTISDETTLLYYVGLYHKIENYENEILTFYNLIHTKNHKNLKEIGIDIPNNKKLFEDRDRIRLICNSIKHNNFYPKPELLKFYPYLKSTQKISLKDLNPIEDTKLIKAYVQYFNMLIIFKGLITAKNNLPESFELSNDLDDFFENFIKDESYKSKKYQSTYLNDNIVNITSGDTSESPSCRKS